MKKGRLCLAILFALLAPIIPAIMLLASQQSFSQVNDLPEYYAAAKLAMEHNGSAIYALAALGEKQRALFPGIGERVIGLYVPPIALPWLLPIAFIPLDLAPAIWTILLIAGAAASLVILKRLFSWDLSQVLALFAVVSVSGPLYEALRIGQLAPLLLLALCVSVWALNARRPLPAALAMSFLLLKPQELAPFVVYLLGARRYRPLIYLGVIGAVLAVASLVMVGPEGVGQYFQLISLSTENTMGMQPELSPTLRGQLLRLFPTYKLAVTIAGFVVCVGALVLVWFCGRTYMRYRQWLELGLITAMPLGLVTALHCHDYDLMLLIPSAVALLSVGIIGRAPVWTRLVAIFGLTMLLLPLYKYIHYDYLLPGGLINPIFLYLLAVSLGLVVLVHNSRLELLLDEEP